MAYNYPSLYNDSWLLVFFHDSSIECFKDKKEASYSLKKHKYSVLKKIDDSFKINGAFEFLLKYPNATGQNHWTQTISPAYAQPNVENGYIPINVSWKGNSFHGLSLCSLSCSYIDGSPFSEDTWFYSIGMISSKPAKIPAYAWENGDKSFYQVYLWLRVIDHSLIRKLFNTRSFGVCRSGVNKLNVCILTFIML